MSENIAFQYHGIFVIFSKQVVFKHVVIFLTLNKKQKSAENKLIIFSGLEFSFCCFVVHILFLFLSFLAFLSCFRGIFEILVRFRSVEQNFLDKIEKVFFFFFLLLSFALFLTNCGKII